MPKIYQEESVNGIVFSPDRGEILLIKRRDVPVWALPGGGIDANETPEQAVLREMEEETGYTVSLVRKIAEYTPLNRLARFTHFFECQITSGSPILTAETQGVSFFSLEEIPPLPPPYPDWISDACQKNAPLFKKKILSVTYLNLLKHFFLHPILVSRFILARLGLHIND